MDEYTGIYRAKVLDNLDPKKLGRIKAEVYPMLVGIGTARDLDGVDGITIDTLPWAVPAMPLFAGAGSSGSSGSFIVPEIESYIWVFFEAGDIYQPCYILEAQTAKAGLPVERLVDYPYTKVWKTPSGFVITIDDKEGSEEIKVLHPSGSYIQIDSNGLVSIRGDINVIGEITADNFISNAGTDYNTHIHTGDSGGNTGVPK